MIFSGYCRWNRLYRRWNCCVFLLRHPNVQVNVLTSRTEDGRRVDDMFPSLRGHTTLRYSDLKIDELKCDVVFFATCRMVLQCNMPKSY